MLLGADRAGGWARQGAGVRSHPPSPRAVTILLGNQMFLNGEKLMSFTPCLRKWPPIHKRHHLKKFRASTDTVHSLFKKPHISQVYHICRHAGCLLGQQKLFLVGELGHWSRSHTAEHRRFAPLQEARLGNARVGAVLGGRGVFCAGRGGRGIVATRCPATWRGGAGGQGSRASEHVTLSNSFSASAMCVYPKDWKLGEENCAFYECQILEKLNYIRVVYIFITEQLHGF